MDELARNIYELVKEDENYGEKFFMTLAIIAVTMICIKLLRKISKKISNKEKSRYWIREIGSYILVIIAISLSFYTWFNALEGLMAAFSIIIALSFIALKDLILNAVGFFYIKFKRPFLIGDRIEIKGHSGDVIDIDLLQFRIEEVGNWLSSTDHTGRTIYISNRDIFSHPLANFSKDFPYIWKDIIIPITHKSNYEKLIDFLNEIATDRLRKLVQTDQNDEEGKVDLSKLSRKIQLFDGNVLPKVGLTVDGDGVDVSLRFLCPYRESGKYETELWKEILNKINSEDDLELSPSVMRVVHSKAENSIQ